MKKILIGADAAALLSTTAGVAVADNLAPATPDNSTSAQPSQQQTGASQPGQTQPGQTSTPSTGEQSTVTKTEPTQTKPTRIWTRRAERGNNGHPRGMSH